MECGAYKNTNKLHEITGEFVSWTEIKLNNSPLKQLGYLTPNEIF